jgi:BASS family bile acid:Na+ symporter
MTLQQSILLAIQVSIMLTVFGFGLQARLEDVLEVVQRPARLARSFLAMFILMPVLAVLLARVFELRPEVEIALVVLSLSPLPPLLPKKQDKAGGRASFGLGLLVTMALLSIAWLPLAAHLVGLVFDRSFTVAPAVIAKIVFKIIVLPLLAGSVFRLLMPRRAERLAQPAGLLGRWLLPAVGLLIVYLSRRELLALLGNGTLVVMVGFVAAGLAIGHRLGGPDPDDRTVLALSTACRHPGIALAAAAANYPDDPHVASAILLYLLLNLLVCLPYVQWRRRRRVEPMPG